MKRYIKSAVRNPAEEPSDAKKRILEDPRTPPEILDSLIKSMDVPDLEDDTDTDDDNNDFEVIVRMVVNSKTSPDLLRRIYNAHMVLDHMFIRNPSTPNDVLEAIYRSDACFSDRMEAFRVLKGRGVHIE